MKLLKHFSVGNTKVNILALTGMIQPSSAFFISYIIFANLLLLYF